jgi:hypothetical protein
MIIIIILKFNVKNWYKTGVSFESGRLLTQVNIKIKMIIIIVLKLDSRQDLEHGLGGSTLVELD